MIFSKIFVYLLLGFQSSKLQSHSLNMETHSKWMRSDNLILFPFCLLIGDQTLTRVKDAVRRRHKDLTMILVVLPDNAAEVKKDTKYWGDIKEGIITQCVVSIIIYIHLMQLLTVFL